MWVNESNNYNNNDIHFSPNGSNDPLLLTKAKKRVKESNYGPIFRVMGFIALIVCLYFYFHTNDFRDKTLLLVITPIACYMATYVIDVIWVFLVIKTAGKIKKSKAYYATIIGGFTCSIIQFIGGLILHYQLTEDERKMSFDNLFRLQKTKMQMKYLVPTFAAIKVVAIIVILSSQFAMVEQVKSNIEKLKWLKNIISFAALGIWLAATLGMIIGLIWNSKILKNNGNKIAYKFLWIGAITSAIIMSIAHWIWERSIDKSLKNNNVNNNNNNGFFDNFNFHNNRNDMPKY